MGELRIIRHDAFVPYQEAWDEQRRLHAARVAGEIEDTIVLLEHEAVYTAGKRTTPEERPLLDAGAPVIDVDRGGKITWHGPGQIVGYPILKLPEPYDVVGYVRRVEQLMLDVCRDLGVDAVRVESDGRSGVWIQPGGGRPDRKIGAVGLRVAKGVTMHGFALNCDNDLGWYDRIVACGIRDADTTTLSHELGRRVTVAEVLPYVERHLDDLLALQPQT
ncbi:lipoyl(octanoyl) transferase LipB [Jiangella aurantiaca]|uniref:Octanoyltransferase n=1 Tax=Jiangella aurantiaca TaxID=2530373 RepID=A0A4R5A7L7_9ACTN|nr:lipoyl(octanoyl) transferase LipB [Jiangella aurantiaca]TDD67100.1 lipoyl(octanoyl) transferase LipB [Jiangella aurantiaca]